MSCRNCRHSNRKISCIICGLTGTVIESDSTCEFENKDLEGNVCGNCVHFFGPNGDYGLCCDANYYAVPVATSKGCDFFKLKN